MQSAVGVSWPQNLYTGCTLVVIMSNWPSRTARGIDSFFDKVNQKYNPLKQVYKCPFCKKNFKYAAGFAGNYTQCPHCHKEVRVAGALGY